MDERVTQELIDSLKRNRSELLHPELPDIIPLTTTDRIFLAELLLRSADKLEFFLTTFGENE